MKRKLFSTFLVLLFAPLSWGWVSHRAKIGDPYSEPYQSSNPKVELRNTRSLHQATSDECYMFAFVGALEVANRNAWNRPYAPPISAEFLFMEKLEAWTKESLTNDFPLDKGFYFLQGGDVHHALRLSIEDGLIPQRLFQPRQEFVDWDFGMLYGEVYEMVKAGRAAVRKGRDNSEKSQIATQVFNDIRSHIAQYSGARPKRFTWKNRTWSPKTFEQQVGIKRNSLVYMLYPTGRWEMGDPWDLRRVLYGMVRVFNGAFRYKQSNWNQIWNYMINSVDSGLPSIVSVKWGKTYHVMNVVGYEYNNQNQIVAFKVKNSWGDDFGDRGYAYYTPDDLQKNISTVWGFQRPE